MVIKHESVYRKTAKLKKYQERFMPAITLPCSSNTAWEVVMAILFLGGRGCYSLLSIRLGNLFANRIIILNFAKSKTIEI